MNIVKKDPIVNNVAPISPPVLNGFFLFILLSIIPVSYEHVTVLLQDNDNYNI